MERRASEDPLSGRRAVDDGARLLIAEHAITEVKNQYSTLADGQQVISSVLIGTLHRDGSSTPGLVAQVQEIRVKQDETGVKLDDVVTDMGDVKSAQADQARTLTEHSTKLDTIITYGKSIVIWLGRGILGALGIGLLHLAVSWWPHPIDAAPIPVVVSTPTPSPTPTPRLPVAR